MMGLDEAGHAFWEAWRPREAAPMAVDIDDGDWTVFDGWGIEDQSYRTDLWNHLFPLLSRLQGVDSEDGDAQGLISVLLRLEHQLDDTLWELSFFSAADGHQEGAVLRIVTPDGVGLWLEAARSAGESSNPDRWVLRVEPAAEEAPGQTWWWTPDNDDWSLSTARGAAASSPTEELHAHGWTPFLDMVIEFWWENITDRAYLEPPFQISDPWPDDPTNKGWCGTLGADIQERELRDFVADTVFVPRSGSSDFEL